MRTGLWLAIVLGLGGACTPAALLNPTTAPGPRPVTAGPPSPRPGTLPPTGAASVVWPALERVEPARAEPGGQVRVLATGGYLIESTGRYDESARYFDLFLDGEPLGTLACYASHCLADLTLPAGLAPGEHVISVAGGSSVTLQVEADLSGFKTTRTPDSPAR